MNETYYNASVPLDLFEVDYDTAHPIIRNMLEGLFICPLMVALSLVFLADKANVPNQLVAMIYGAFIGLMYYYLLPVQVVFFWKPDHVIILCHPIMLTKIAITLDVYVFSRSKWQILIIATIGTGIFICLFGFLIMVMTNSEVNLVNIVAAGTTLAAIDVPDVLMELNKIKNLEVVMDGESVFGAALCIMTYNFCNGYYDGMITEWYHVVNLYLRYIILGLIMGFVIGKTVARTYRLFYDDSYNATFTLLGTAYASYILCEKYIYCSATICTFFVGYLIAKERSRLSPSTNRELQIVVDNAYNAVEFLNCIILSAIVTYGIIKMYKGFDLAVAVGVYIMGNALRILIFLVLSPILSRIGLGFNTTTLLTISWAAKRGSLQLLQVIYVDYYKVTQILGTELLCFTVVYLAFSFLINMTSLGFILKYFGLIEFTKARKNNITQCITMLMGRRQRVIFALKTNRFLSDLNWELIHRATALHNPYVSVSGDLARNEFETTCSTCYRTIPYISSLREQNELIKDVKTKMLKRQRITLVREYELGLLTKTELEIILQYVESALNSPYLNIPYNYFLDLFNIDKFYLKWQNQMGMKKKDEGPMVWRRWAAYNFPLRFVRKQWFTYLKFIVNILTCLLIIIWLLLAGFGVPGANIALWVGYGFTLFFIFELVLYIISYKCSSLIWFYFKNVWNCLGLCILILDIAAFIASVAFSFHYIRIACLARILTLEQLGIYLIPYIYRLIDREIDKKMSYAFSLGLAIVTSIEEVEANLHLFCKIPEVRDYLSVQIQSDKMRFLEKLAIVQNTRPRVAVTNCTFQLEMAILKTMLMTAHEIRTVGVVEDFEYRILQNIIQNTIRKIHPTTAVQLNTAKTMLREIPWMGEDDDMFEYLYSNVMLKIWESGEVLCDIGDHTDGVVILMQGLLKMTYEPNEEIIDQWNTFGMVPVKDILNSIYFQEPSEEYLFMGNTIGELSFLTERPYDCRIEAVRSTSGLILTKAVLKQAKEFNTDPIYGLIPQMWKQVHCRLAWRILSERSHYHDLEVTSMHTLFNRAFVPDISHYRVFQVSNYITDILLLDGMIIDKITKHPYVAPCSIPRSVHQIQIPELGPHCKVQPKLMVIPQIMIDSYTVMQGTEDLSDTIPDLESSAPIRNIQVRKIKRDCALEMIRVAEDIKKNSDIQLVKLRHSSINETQIISILGYLSEKKYGFNYKL